MLRHGAHDHTEHPPRLAELGLAEGTGRLSVDARVASGSRRSQLVGGHGDEQYITASVEPSGVLLEVQLDTGHWTGWLTLLCARLSLSLGREIHDAEV